jgi:hypothetical protein
LIRRHKAARGRNLASNEHKDPSGVTTDVADRILLVMPRGVGGVT